jgi:hypothetical protein
MPSKDPTLAIFAKILNDTYVDCPDTEPYLVDPRSPKESFAWGAPWKIQAFVDMFVTDPEHKIRIQNALLAVDAFFADLAKLSFTDTGTPQTLPDELIAELKKRILIGYFPSPSEIVREATSGNAARAKQLLLKHIPEEDWNR